MNADEFKKRTKRFALEIIRVVESLPKTATAYTIGGQLLRCGTSVGSNYRSACRARSRRDFVNKMGIVEEESDECLYWMELLIEAAIVKVEFLCDVMAEGREILSMVVRSIRTARSRG
jgi:four helix bundle protein